MLVGRPLLALVLVAIPGCSAENPLIARLSPGALATIDSQGTLKFVELRPVDADNFPQGSAAWRAGLLQDGDGVAVVRDSRSPDDGSRDVEIEVVRVGAAANADLAGTHALVARKYLRPKPRE